MSSADQNKSPSISVGHDPELDGPIKLPKLVSAPKLPKYLARLQAGDRVSKTAATGPLRTLLGTVQSVSGGTAVVLWDENAHPEKCWLKARLLEC